MVANPNENTEPHVQPLFVGSYWETGMWTQVLASVWLSVYTHHTLALPASYFYIKMSKELICAQCGNVGKTKSNTPGSIIIEILMYCMFIIPGLIYSMWRLSSRKMVCGVCGSLDLIPVDSPKGKKLLEESK